MYAFLGIQLLITFCWNLEWIFCWNLVCFTWYWAAKFGTCAQTGISKFCGINHTIFFTNWSINDYTHSRDAIHVKRIFFIILIKKMLANLLKLKCQCNSTQQLHPPTPVVTIIGTNKIPVVKPWFIDGLVLSRVLSILTFEKITEVSTAYKYLLG